MSKLPLAYDCARILLVDDNHDVRACMRRVLVQAGHDVVEAGSGDAGAALIRDAVHFDLLVTDIHMPGSRDGVMLAACWRDRAPGRPVLFVSGLVGDRLDANAPGLHEAVLHKPFRRAALLDVVRQLLAQHGTVVAPALVLTGQVGAAPLASAVQRRWRA